MPPEVIFGFLLAGILWTFFPDGPGGRNGGQERMSQDQIEMIKRMKGH